MGVYSDARLKDAINEIHEMVAVVKMDVESIRESLKKMNEVLRLLKERKGK